MRTKRTTLTRKINFSNPSIELPCNSILNAVLMNFEITVSNGGASAVTPTISDVLKGVSEIKLETDGDRVHYNMNALDAARMNAFDGNQGTNAVLNQTLSSIAASGTGTVKFPIIFDKGDIMGAERDNITLKAAFNTGEIADDLTITAANVEVTTLERILSNTEAENIYGKNLVRFVEPKVIATTHTNPINSELAGFYDLPTGTLLRQSYLNFSATPSRIGLIENSPERVERLNLSWDAWMDLNKFAYGTNTIPSNTVVLNYGTEVADNGLGLFGWNYRKSDYQIATKNASAVDMRVISVETVVDQILFEKYGAVIECPMGY